MKYSEKMGLLTKGVSWAEIKELEKQEAEEAEAAALEEKKDEEARKAEDEAKKAALEAAQEMVKELETKLSAKDDELKKLNAQFADLNNKRTIKEEPEAKDSAADVMKQLFHPKLKEKEEK